MFFEQSVFTNRCIVLYNLAKKRQRFLFRTKYNVTLLFLNSMGGSIFRCSKLRWATYGYHAILVHTAIFHGKKLVTKSSTNNAKECRVFENRKKVSQKENVCLGNNGFAKKSYFCAFFLRWLTKICHWTVTQYLT